MGDSIGPAKTYGTHNPMYDYGYINRRGGWVAYGRDYYKISGIAKNDNDNLQIPVHIMKEISVT